MSDKLLWRLVKQVYESENNGELVEEAIVEIERLRARVALLEFEIHHHLGGGPKYRLRAAVEGKL